MFLPCSDDSKTKTAARMSLLRKSLKQAKQNEQNDNLVNNENDANISLEQGKDFVFNSWKFSCFQKFLESCRD